MRKAKIILNAFALLGLAGILYWIFTREESMHVSFWLKTNLQMLNFYYQQYPLLSLLIFCMAHLISSTASLPGSCTFLNILAGAVFGFSAGSAVVYFITFVGAVTGYVLGSKISLNFLPVHYQQKLSKIQEMVAEAPPALLIMLRLSPLLPFGMLNILCGHLRMPFWTYLGTTLIGVFFDVFLLSSIGALFTGQTGNLLQNKGAMIAVFLFLFLAYLCVKLFKNKLLPQQNTEKI